MCSSFREEIQTLHQHWASKEAELSRVIKDAGSLLKVELNACKQQLELERSRTRALHNRFKVKDNPHILGKMFNLLINLFSNSFIHKYIQRE